VGNRLTSASATNWTYNANNELGSYNGSTFQYDNNGNTVQKDASGVVRNYVYDADNRLIEVKDVGNSTIATYIYDPFGRRISKTVSNTTTYYCYADEGLIAEYSGTGDEIKTYGYKPGSTWTTDPLFMKLGSQYYFYQNDHLGTPQKLISDSGAVVWSATYDDFGKATVDAGSSVTNDLRFAGQYYDEETRFHYNYNRFYDPDTGRYIEIDPLGIDDGQFTLYDYAYCSPLVNIDPFGLYSSDVHYDYTFGIAKGVGYSECAAKKIAQADNNIDIKYNPLNPWKVNEKKRGLWHFPSEQRVNEVLYSAFNSCDLATLGEALHVLQDSYSHAGYRPKWGHVWTPTPDDVKVDPKKTDRVVKETMRIFEAFEKKCWDITRDKCCEK